MHVRSDQTTNDDLPLVSVVIPTYNRADLLPESVESVLSQDYPNFEVIIVDDCSTDSTPEVIESLVERDPDRVESMRLPENRGPAAARNAGIRAARGSLIAFQDSDDLWLPGKLTAQVEALRRHPECGLCYGKALVATAEGVPTSEVYGGSGRGRTGDSFEAMLRYHAIYGPTLMVRSSAFRNVGLFDEVLRTAEDTDLFLRLALRHRAVYLSRPLALVRQHAGRKTRPERVDGRIADCCLAAFVKLWQNLPPCHRRHRGLLAQKAFLNWLSLPEWATETNGAGVRADALLTRLTWEWLDYFEVLAIIADRFERTGLTCVQVAAEAQASTSDRGAEVWRTVLTHIDKSDWRAGALQVALARQSLRQGNLLRASRHAVAAVRRSPFAVCRHLLLPAPCILLNRLRPRRADDSNEE